MSFDWFGNCSRGAVRRASSAPFENCKQRHPYFRVSDTLNTEKSEIFDEVTIISKKFCTVWENQDSIFKLMQTMGKRNDKYDTWKLIILFTDLHKNSNITVNVKRTIRVKWIYLNGHDLWRGVWVVFFELWIVWSRQLQLKNCRFYMLHVSSDVEVFEKIYQ